MGKTKQGLLWALTFVAGLGLGYGVERKIVERSESAIIMQLLQCESEHISVNVL